MSHYIVLTQIQGNRSVPFRSLLITLGFLRLFARILPASMPGSCCARGTRNLKQFRPIRQHRGLSCVNWQVFELGGLPRGDRVGSVCQGGAGECDMDQKSNGFWPVSHTIHTIRQDWRVDEQLSTPMSSRSVPKAWCPRDACFLLILCLYTVIVLGRTWTQRYSHNHVTRTQTA